MLATAFTQSASDSMSVKSWKSRSVFPVFHNGIAFKSGQHKKLTYINEVDLFKLAAIN